LGRCAAGGYQIERSLRFNSADSAYLNRTFSAPTNGQKFSFSFWTKRSVLSSEITIFAADAAGASNESAITLNSGNTLEVRLSGVICRRTTQLFRDPSAWYHIIIVLDTTQATPNDRVKVYLNGTQITAFTTTANPTQNSTEVSFNTAIAHYIGRWASSGIQYFDGYLTEINFIDGQALDPTSFGEFNEDTGVWQPIEYTGTYGTNGFYLNFSDNSGVTSTTLGKDQAGSNNWTPNNFSVTAGAGNDSLVDTPTNYGTDTGVGGEVRGNYATLNPLRNGGFTLTNGNLEFGGTTSDRQVAGTIAFPTSGKWYFEATPTAIGANSYWGVGIMNTTVTVTSAGLATEGFEGYAATGLKFSGAGYVAYGNSFTTSNTIGVAVDMDNGAIYFAKDNTWQNSGVPTSGASKTGAAFTDLLSSGYTWTPGIFSFNASQSGITNFGQRPFAYTAPSGFKALCTQNLPEPTIVDGGEYFNTIVWAGNAANPRTLTGVGFQPDLVWGKVRNYTYDPLLYDAVRGAGITKALGSSNTAAEGSMGDNATNGYISAFTADGFSVVGSGNPGYWNSSGENYVAWNWKANGAGSSNTDGTITSTVSASTDSGFSIVTYTGTGSNATVGHGLGAVPRMIIVKNRDQADAWQVYHAANTANPETDYLVLNTTAATADAADRWNDTLPTSTVFSIGNGVEVNTNTEDYVAYVFAAIPGYSAISSFTGNGSADGPFIFTNHRPAFVLIKRTDTTSNWTILDFQREGYNVDNDPLFPNLTNAEGTTDLADLLSNGFKLRTTDASVNASGGTYIYMSLATNPFKYSLAR
jgi:hypothetical protein